MIDTLNTNRKVTILGIILISNNKWNSEIVRLIINRYTNVYTIHIYNNNYQVDHQIHNMIR